jgi:PhzF family phenazine biosynthesis protein
MSVPIYQVDAFAERPFEGNPAAVCLLNEPRTPAWMQAVAREMNLSETAFVWPAGDGYVLRWFTPALEVDLCGHATLAAAHVLWEVGWVGRNAAAEFQTRSGILTAQLTGTGIEMSFPATPARPADAPAGLTKALRVSPVHVGRSQFDYLFVLGSERHVRELRPEYSLLAQLDARGVIVTSRSAGPEHDFVSRFFAPRSGIDEDPVTGSAHCCLGPFWGSQLGKTEMVGYQASARGGVVRVRLEGDRVILGGTAVTVLRGELVNSG